MRILLMLVAAAPFILANTYADAQSAHRMKPHVKLYPLDGHNGTFFDKLKGHPGDLTKSNSDHQGLINGTTPGPKRTAGDTQSDK
jgi:hypothetical protein